MPPMMVQNPLNVEFQRRLVSRVVSAMLCGSRPLPHTSRLAAG